MRRGELSKKTGCNPETIRYYETIGLMPEPPRSRGGYRQYDMEHARRLRFIMRGRELGFGVEDVRGLLDLVDRRAVSCGEVMTVAEKHIMSIRKRIRDLRRMDCTLSRTIKACSGRDVPDCPLIDSLFERN